MRVPFHLPDGWPWSIWFFVITLAVYLLQRFPLTGVFLMIVGGAFWSIILVNLGMGGIIVEAVTGKVSPLWLALPALYFGGYYLAYASDQRSFARLAAQTAKFNAGKGLEFHPERQDLVVDQRGDGLGFQARDMVDQYGLARAFGSDGRAWVIGTADTCKLINSDRAFMSAGIQGHMITRMGPRRYQTVSTGFCMVMMPGTPDRPVMRITQQQQNGKTGLLDYITTAITARDESSGRSTTVRHVRAAPLRRFPMPVMGCALNSGAPAWQCFHGFMRHEQTPVNSGLSRYSSGAPIIAEALGLKRDNDYAPRAIGPERFQPIADRIDAEKTAKELALLERMLANPTEHVRDGWFHHLPNRPTVVEPYAERIFAALETLQRSDAKDSENGRNLWRLVAVMSDDALAPYRAQITDWLRPGNARPWTVREDNIYERLDASHPVDREIMLNRLETERGDLKTGLLGQFCAMGSRAPDEVKKRLLALWNARGIARPGYPEGRGREDVMLYFTLARMGLKAAAGKVEQRYYGPTYLRIWEEVGPDTHADLCAGSINDLSNAFRRR